MAQTQDQTFRVISENVPCGVSGNTCAKNIFVYYNALSITLIRGRLIEVNNKLLDNLELGAQVFGDVTIRKAAMYFVINSTDFVLKWDGATRLYIIIHPAWVGKMQGVCGNYDYDKTNDMKTISGISGSTINDMVESWKLDQTCAVISNPLIDESNPCQGHEQRHQWAAAECKLINDPSPNNPFSDCIKMLDAGEVEKSHTECMFDACNCDRGGDCECLCSSLAAFGELCIRAGVPVKWRTNQRCPIQCEGEKIYQACGSLCERTCKDLNSDLNIDASCGDETCVEGCFCPEGFFTNSEGVCVPQDSCECYLGENAYINGTSVKKGCMSCLCVEGVFNCVPTKECHSCNAGEFSCKTDGKCIPRSHLCDNSFDCADMSDEVNCTCEADAFICANGHCVKGFNKCDGFPDCRDGSDELDCRSCLEFECLVNDKCIPSKKRFRKAYSY